MDEEDEILFLNFNRFTCLRRAFKRRKQYKGKNRFSMTEGCEERISWEFFWWLIWEGRTKKRKQKFHLLQDKYQTKMLVIKNQRQLDAFKSSIVDGLKKAEKEEMQSTAVIDEAKQID